MIESFRDKRAAAVFQGRMPKGFPSDVAAVARRKLRMLDAATRLDDLRAPPANRLEALTGDRAGQYSIRINDQWRVCFTWRGAAAADVEIDHQEWTMADPILRTALKRTDLSDATTGETLPNVAPGEVLSAEFMRPAGLSARALAREIGVPANRITEVLNGQRSVSPDTAIRLGDRFATTAEFWLNLQTAFDLEAVRRARHSTERPDAEDPVGGTIRRDLRDIGRGHE